MDAPPKLLRQYHSRYLHMRAPAASEGPCVIYARTLHHNQIHSRTVDSDIVTTAKDLLPVLKIRAMESRASHWNLWYVSRWG